MEQEWLRKNCAKHFLLYRRLNTETFSNEIESAIAVNEAD